MILNGAILICLFYGALLFAIAYFADRAEKRQQMRWLRSPFVYTLSLSVYCTAWTFYGAVGSAVRSGLEFVAIYLGPSLAFFAWWIFLRRMVRIGHAQNITSIADFISSRYGKSTALASLVTAIMFFATIPYIALQLQSIAQSFAVFFPELGNEGRQGIIGAVSAFGLGAFAILFGTRNAYVNERQSGVVAAIAFESIVKLVAVISVGIFAISYAGGRSFVFDSPITTRLLEEPIFDGRWFTLVSLSFMAVLVLPRMFHVIVVENHDENHLYTASWAFPLYLLLLNIFVLPIAIVGLHFVGSSNPDYYILSVPLAAGKTELAYLSLLGGFSAATSMVIISAIAVSTMVSNHVLMPLWLDARGNRQNPDDVRYVLLKIRRLVIAAVMLISFAYFQYAGSADSLATIGTIAFLGAAQVFPSLVAALFWRGATRFGAGLGLAIGGMVWAYSLLLPAVNVADNSIADLRNIGIFGWEWLAPYNLFHSNIADPLVHAFVWSLGLNCTALFVGSILSRHSPLELVQANAFVQISDPLSRGARVARPLNVGIEEYFLLTQRILGVEKTATLFRNIAQAQGRVGEVPVPNNFFTDRLESALRGVLGSAAAHTLLTQIAGQATVPVSETIKLADETIQNIEYAKALEQQSQELEKTMAALRDANSALIALDAQKDAFLSQVSHELRTPMTAIRSFTEILLEDDDLPEMERKRLLQIVAKENVRLTGLLDEILDISYLESGRAQMELQGHDLRKIIEHAVNATEPVWGGAGLAIQSALGDSPAVVKCDFNRLSQVFINLITNAAKYARSEHPNLAISIGEETDSFYVDFSDNGPGIAPTIKDHIFEKFARGERSELAGSAGLGLAISREIAENMGGKLELLPSLRGASFRMTLPKT